MTFGSVDSGEMSVKRLPTGVQMCKFCSFFFLSNHVTFFFQMHMTDDAYGRVGGEWGRHEPDDL